MREPEPRIVNAAAAGDPRAFEELVRTYLGDVYRLARHLVRDHDTAEDVAQDTFVQAWRALPRFRGDAKFSTWLFRIARNASVDAVRRSARRREVERPEAADPPPSDPAMTLALRQAIDALSDELREPFVLIEIFGFTYPEAAKILHTRIGTVKSRMHRTRRILSAALIEEDTGEV